MNTLFLPPSPGPTRRGVLRAAGAGSALLTLAACRSAVSHSESDEVGASAAPRRGGTLTVAHGVDFTPALLFSQSSMSLPQRLVFNTLTRYDDDLRPQPELAESWEVSPDGTTVTLRLRRGVTYHDGRPFTADDVVFAVENLQTPERSAQLRSTAEAVTALDKRGDHELTLTLAHPVGNLFDLFEFMIIPDRNTVEEALTGDRLVGTGPFRFDGWRPGSLLTFSRNDSYWQSGRPYLDGVEIRVITQTDSLLSSLRTGQSQLSLGVVGRDAATLKDDPQFTITTYTTGNGCSYVGANTAVRPTNDKTVRQAIAWALDRERIVEQAYGGFALASAAPWPESSPVFTEDNRTHYRHDPDRARELLRQAGATDISLPLGYSASPGNTVIAEMVQYDLEQVGIRTELQPYDPANAQRRLISQEMPALWTMNHGFAQVTPSTLAVSAYPFNEAHNTSRFQSAEYTGLVQDAWRRADPLDEEALDLYQRIADVLLDEAFIIDIAVLDIVQVARADVRGVTLNKFNYLTLDDAFLA
ncbi:ABC transporter substrate-binding protein [Streptomyces litchfieldiae]|uniref:ABC transporter substrate-binding protein n=1 Tax=Streptomyces litchfieldiae TaxID=3075543 RepID=A0ABU2MXC5_9ACTN|nr:ABC transporter substrate-binding protein [Streptomyces sp. DSM 44938]MDT0345928.1 ABC transporter substrate-binding protein [Streptomyces sp. DSM 44938]